jgi:hypothetical protein
MNKRVFRATGAAAIAQTLAPTTAFQIEEIRLHLNLAGGAAEDLTVVLDSGVGAAYDTVLLTQAMAAVSDLVWQPTRPLVFSAGDEIDIAYANTNTRTYGLEIYWTPIY